MMELLTSLLSAGSGGLFGGLMAVGSAWIKGRQIKEQFKMDMEVRKFELEAMASGHMQKLEELRQMASSNGLLASLNADASIQNVSPWAANIKAIYRPFLTTLLTCLTVILFIELLDAYRGNENLASELFNGKEILQMMRYAADSLVFATVTAIVWWFGERALTPPISK